MNPLPKLQILFRTPEQKADLAGSWARSDEDFFAAGACHILAGIFLLTYPERGFSTVMIRPAEGFHGNHVIVANGSRVYDCRGWNDREDFLRRYTAACGEIYRGWSCTLEEIADPLSWDFCTTHNHRHASQFFRDPLPRAKAFLMQFPPFPGFQPSHLPTRRESRT